MAAFGLASTIYACGLSAMPVPGMAALQHRAFFRVDNLSAMPVPGMAAFA